MPEPLLTAKLAAQLMAARRSGMDTLQCSLDLQRSLSTVRIGQDRWAYAGAQFPYPVRLKERTVYYWRDAGFQPVARYGRALVKLIPTDWGPPTFEIDGVKMLPTDAISPWEDAQRKVALVAARGARLLDCCGGLGYFAHWSVQARALHVTSYENNADVLWVRSLNPWSPRDLPNLQLTQADVNEAIAVLPDASMDAALHDPPRFALAGELYSQYFYGQLARVLIRGGRLFHYTGAPNGRSRGRDLAAEVKARLQLAGFSVERRLDGLLATKR